MEVARFPVTSTFYPTLTVKTHGLWAMAVGSFHRHAKPNQDKNRPNNVIKPRIEGRGRTRELLRYGIDHR